MASNIHLTAELQELAPDGFSDPTLLALQSRQWIHRAISLIEAAVGQLGNEEHRVQSALSEAALLLRQRSHAAVPVDSAAAGYRALSSRELSILRMIAHGMSNKRIAQSLGIAPETVKSHAKKIFLKLGARTRVEAVSRATSLGLI